MAVTNFDELSLRVIGYYQSQSWVGGGVGERWGDVGTFHHAIISSSDSVPIPQIVTISVWHSADSADGMT